MGAPRKQVEDTKPRTRPATSPDEQEDLMISLAMKQAQQQLEAGTASNQVLTHYLKLGTVREAREREQLRLNNELLAAKTDDIRAASERDVDAAEVLKALKTYRGEDEGEDDEDQDIY